MELILAILCGVGVWIISGSFAAQDLVCLKNHTFTELPGDAVLSLFVDTDYGSECNISSLKSNQEVAIALFVVHTLNKLEYIPGVKIGLRVYDTCNDRVSVYRDALSSAIESGCSSQYNLGILAPDRFMEVLNPLQSLDVLPIFAYGSSSNLNMVLIDALVDFISTYSAKIDLVLSNSRPTLERFYNASKDAGICVRSEKDLEWKNNETELVLVALGDYDDLSVWIDEIENTGDQDVSRVWILLPMDNSNVDELLPEGGFVLEPGEFFLDLSEGLDSADISQVPVRSIMESPYLLSIGKSILEIVKVFQELQTESCPFGALECTLPRFKDQELKSITNARLYEMLRIPAKSYSTRYAISQKIDDAMLEIKEYKIDATSAPLRVLKSKDQKRLSDLCIKRRAKHCNNCINFQVQENKKMERPEEEGEGEDEDEGERGVELEKELQLSTLRSEFWVPIFLTIASCGTLACLLVLAFIIYMYFVEYVLDGNPALTVLLILATVMMLQSIVPFCLEERARDAAHLNASKIFVSTFSFGLAFSVLLTRALFLAFSTSGVFSQHINGYLQSFMLFFMAAVELGISTVYFALGTESARVMRSPLYVALLGYDIFLLVLLFIVSCFIGQIRRNYNEGICFFGTSIGLILCWSVWLTCFLLMSADKRDLIVCYGIIGTALSIIIGILVPRTYFMCAHLNRKRNIIPRLEPMDILPDPRMNNIARQALDLQSRQTMYEYMNGGISEMLQQQQHQQHQPQPHPQPHPQPTVNYYGCASPKKRYNVRHRTLEPRHTLGTSNYGFQPEMREADDAYVIPELNVEDCEMKKVPQSTMKRQSRAPAPQPNYTMPKPLVRNPRNPRNQDETSRCPETEVYVQDRLSPATHGYNERYPRRCSSPKLSPTHATIHEEPESERKTKITKF